MTTPYKRVLAVLDDIDGDWYNVIVIYGGSEAIIDQITEAFFKVDGHEDYKEEADNFLPEDQEESPVLSAFDICDEFLGSLVDSKDDITGEEDYVIYTGTVYID